VFASILLMIKLFLNLYFTFSQQSTNLKVEDVQLSMDDLEMIQVIGKGSGGVVQLVRHKWVGTLYALKVISSAMISSGAHHTHYCNGNSVFCLPCICTLFFYWHENQFYLFRWDMGSICLNLFKKFYCLFCLVNTWNLII